MTFDWSQIAYIGSPLVVPFWAALNIIGGLVVVMWVMAPIMCKFSKNVQHTKLTIIPRLYKYPVLFLPPYPIIGRFRQHGQPVRRQQNPDARLPLRRSSLQNIQPCLPSNNLRSQLRSTIRSSRSTSHAHNLLAWQRHLAAMETQPH